MKRNVFFPIKEYLVFFLALIFAVILVFNGFDYAVRGGLDMFICYLLPSFLPYFFITSVLSSLSITSKIGKPFSRLFNKAFNVSGAVVYPFLMSILSGYPIGASIVSGLKEKGVLGQAESVRAVILCSTSSPVFTVTCVGITMFCSKTFGILLFLTHFISAIIIGVIFSFYKKDEKNKNTALPPFNYDLSLYDSAYSSAISVLVVGAIIVLFFTFTEILDFYNILLPLKNLFNIIFNNEITASGITLGLFETTKGISTLAKGGITLFSLPTVSMLLGFGGLSVIFQSLAFIKKAKIKTPPFILSKILSGVINFVVGLVFSLIFF